LRALASDGLPPGMQPSTLSVVQQHGSYSGRRVRYFREFDPIRVADRSAHTDDEQVVFPTRSA
jgi:hypothetical protein